MSCNGDGRDTQEYKEEFIDAKGDSYYITKYKNVRCSGCNNCKPKKNNK